MKLSVVCIGLVTKVVAKRSNEPKLEDKDKDSIQIKDTYKDQYKCNNK
jgi:hypothetical protein